MEYSPREMMAIAAGRFIKDGDVLFAGTGVAMLAATVAKRIHAPHAHIFFETGGIGPTLEELPMAAADPRVMAFANLNAGLVEAFSYVANRRLHTIAFLGAAQIDKYGNVNSTVIGDYRWTSPTWAERSRASGGGARRARPRWPSWPSEARRAGSPWTCRLWTAPEASVFPGRPPRSVVPGSTIMTDGWPSYRRLTAIGCVHEPRVQKSPRDAASLLPWVHVVVFNFKRWILDVFHGVSPKHLQSYLDEFCYRLNRRYARTDLFRRIVNRCVRFTEPVTHAQLTAS